MIMSLSNILKTSAIAGSFGLLFSPMTVHAAQVGISLQNHVFSPAEIHAPAGQPVTIVVSNLDATPAEFESKTLRFEQVVKGGGRISVQVRSLSPGRYRFYDDYHEDTTEGFLVVQ